MKMSGWVCQWSPPKDMENRQKKFFFSDQIYVYMGFPIHGLSSNYRALPLGHWLNIFEYMFHVTLLEERKENDYEAIKDNKCLQFFSFFFCMLICIGI